VRTPLPTPPVTNLPVLSDPEAPPTSRGSALCLQCGLCCQGTLHRGAALKPEDEAIASLLRLPIYEKPGGRGFTLPCPWHREGRCGVYDVRPSPCREYECDLLERHLRGDVSLEDALKTVGTAKEMARDLRAAMKSRGLPHSGNLWNALEQFAHRQQGKAHSPAVHRDAAILLLAGRLLAQVRRHFEPLETEGGRGKEEPSMGERLRG
jgi:uncharacterized protein